MLPEQFTNRMKELLKEEYADFAACYGNDHAHSLRINPLKGTKEQYDQTSVFKEREPLKEQVAWEENGFYYEDFLQPGKHPFHEAGVYYIQEASAMAPAAICKRAEPDFVNFADDEKTGSGNDTEGQGEKKNSADLRFFPEGKVPRWQRPWQAEEFCSAMKFIRQGQRFCLRISNEWEL